MSLMGNQGIYQLVITVFMSINEHWWASINIECVVKFLWNWRLIFLRFCNKDWDYWCASRTAMVSRLPPATFGGQHHRSSSHRRSIFHFPFVLSCLPTQSHFHGELLDEEQTGIIAPFLEIKVLSFKSIVINSALIIWLYHWRSSMVFALASDQRWFPRDIVHHFDNALGNDITDRLEKHL